MVSDVQIETKDEFDSGLDTTYYFGTEAYQFRTDRGLKVYALAIPTVISQLFKLKANPTFVTDFGKGRIYVNINFIINEGTRDSNELELMTLSKFIRVNCYKADHCWLSIGTKIKSDGEPLTDSSKGVEGKVLRLMARKAATEDVIYCTLQFVHCVALSLI